jgi:hypothetical protein
MALVTQSQGENQGLANPALYRLGAVSPGVYHDTTVASSGVASCDVGTPSMCNNSDPGPTGLAGGLPGFLVTDGFDEATGWGTLDVAAVVSAWVPVAEPVILVKPNVLVATAGGSAQAAVTTRGFAGTPALSCAGLPAEAACVFAGSGSDATLTITTTAPHFAGGAAPAPAAGGTSGGGWWWVVFGAGALALLRGLRDRRARGVVLAAALAAATSCTSKNGGKADSGVVEDAPRDSGGSAIDAAGSNVDARVSDAPGDLGTPTGDYSVTVTATDGAATASTLVDLTVE